MSNSCMFPTKKNEEKDLRWSSQFNRLVSDTKEAEPDVIFIGDSIIQQMQCYPIWNDLISPLHPLNLGIGGDRIEHVLYRIAHGFLETTSPKAIVLHVGTNNIECGADAISEGILEVVKKLREIFATAHIIIWGLLPRGEYETPIREVVRKVNRTLCEKISNVQNAEFLDTGSLALRDGLLTREDFYDFLHPTEHGYRLMFQPLYNRLLDIINFE